MRVARTVRTRSLPTNSCRNRHCPKCQGAAAKQWLAEREAELLPVGYFHLVFVPGGGISLEGARWVSCRPGFFCQYGFSRAYSGDCSWASSSQPTRLDA